MSRALLLLSLGFFLFQAWRLSRSLDRLSAVQREGTAELSRALDRRAENVDVALKRLESALREREALLRRIDEAEARLRDSE